MPHPDALTPRDLFKRLLSGHAPVVIDIRVADDLELDPGWMPASHRLRFDDLDGHLAVADPEAEVVFACHGGLKLSQGAAARLALRRGNTAAYLAGGCLGWRAAGLPLFDGAPGLWASGGDTPEAVAARWLAARFLPRPHELVHVETDQVALVADRFGGQVLPMPAALLQRLDRSVQGLDEAVAFAATSDFARLLRGGGAPCAFATLDAWALGAEGAA